MDTSDAFSRELRSARERIAELQRRAGTGPGPGDGLLPEVLAELDVAIEELSVTGQELRSQTDELATTRLALEAQRQRYQELFESAPVAYLITDPLASIGEANRAAARLLAVDQRFLAGDAAGRSWPTRPPSTAWGRPWPRPSASTAGRSAPA